MVEKFKSFCNDNRIKHTFSTPQTPQQKGVVEMKNRSLIEIVGMMLYETNLTKYFWVDVVSTTCYVMNHVSIRFILKQTFYDLYKGRKLKISHLHIFGCKCFVLKNKKDNFGKFDTKFGEVIFNL